MENDRPISFTRQQDGDGSSIIGVQWAGSDSAYASFDAALLNSPALGPAVKSLMSATTIATLALEKATETLNAEGVRQRAPNDIRHGMSKAFQLAIQAGMDAAAKYDADWQERLARNLDPAIAAEQRALLRTMKPGDAAQRVLTSANAARAALDEWTATGLPEGLRSEVEEALWRMNTYEGLASQHAREFQQRPTPDNPLRRGIDRDRLEREIANGLGKIKSARAEIDILSSTLSNLVQFAATVAGIGTVAAFDILTGSE